MSGPPDLAQGDAWLRRERVRVARELHPDRGGSVDDYLAALADLERHAHGPEAGRANAVEVRTTLVGRVRRGRRTVAAKATAARRGASRGVAVGRRLIRRPGRSPRVR
jgi:hypothetical protein